MSINKLKEIYGEFDYCVVDRKNKILSCIDINTKIKKYFMSENSQWILCI